MLSHLLCVSHDVYSNTSRTAVTYIKPTTLSLTPVCGTMQDPVLLANATANFGSAVAAGQAPGVPAAFRAGGANQIFTQSAQVVSYR